MNYKTFSRISFLLLFVVACTTLYFILIKETSPSLKNRIANFSNVSFSDMNDVQLEAIAPVKKSTYFLFDTKEYQISLAAQSSKLFMNKEEEAITITEALNQCIITLNNTLYCKTINFSDLCIMSDQTIIDYTKRALFLTKSLLKGSFNSNSKKKQTFNLSLERCSINQAQIALVQGSGIHLSSNDLNIKSDELFFDGKNLTLKKDVVLKINHEKKGLQTLTATKAIFDLDKKVLLCFSDEKKPITLFNKEHQTQFMAKNCTIDFSNGFNQTCITSDDVVKCTTQKKKNTLCKNGGKFE